MSAWVESLVIVDCVENTNFDYDFIKDFICSLAASSDRKSNACPKSPWARALLSGKISK